MWGTRRSEKVTLLVALKFFMLRSVRSVMCYTCDATPDSAPPAALTRPRRAAARTQTMAHAIPLAQQASLGAAPPQAIAGVGVIAATRSRRRMSSPVAAVAGSSCRLRLLTRQRSWRRRGSAGGGVSAVDALHERAQHAAPAGTAAGRSVEGRPRMHECYTRECGVNAASRPAPRGARALPAPSRQRAAPSCVRANCPDSATRRPLVLLRVAPQLAVPCSTTWKHAHGISGLSSGATTGRLCS